MGKRKENCKDSYIIGLLKRGTKRAKERAFRLIMDCHRSPIEGPARKARASKAEVDDHWQNVLLRFFDRFCGEPSLLKEGSFGGLLGTISKNIWENERKKVQKRMEKESEGAEKSREDDSDGNARFLEMIQRLQEECRTIIIQRLVHGMTFLEIAEAHGDTNATKFSRKYYRCIEKLR